MSENTAKFADQFLSIFQKAAVTATGERQRIQAEIVKLGTQRAEIDGKIRDLEKQLAALEDDIAVALKHAAREAGLKLDISGHAPAPGATGTRRTLSRSAADERNIVIDWLKTQNGKYTGAEIRKATGVERDLAVILMNVEIVKHEGQRKQKVYWIPQ